MKPYIMHKFYPISIVFDEKDLWGVSPFRSVKSSNI